MVKGKEVDTVDNNADALQEPLDVVLLDAVRKELYVRFGSPRTGD